jgi:hypothetical protein
MMAARMLSPDTSTHEGAPVLLPPGVARRPLPANFDPADLPLFAHELERELPAARLLDLRGVGVSPEGMLFKGWRVLPESFSSPEIMRDFFGRRRSVLKFFAANQLARPRRRIAGARLWVTDDWSYGYFHWLADALPRLLAARGHAAGATLLLPAAYARLEFVAASLAHFDLGGVEYLPAGEVAFCERLLLPTHAAPSGNYREELMRELRDRLAGGPGGGAGGERIYLSRGRAPKRRVANEPEILGALAEFGFRVVHFEEHPFAEQVRIARAARFLVSNHGAGLTNMLFMPEGGSVLELRREGEGERNWFFNLAAAVGLRYFYQNCAAADAAGAHAGDVLVDPRRLRENLAKMLAA